MEKREAKYDIRVNGDLYGKTAPRLASRVERARGKTPECRREHPTPPAR